MIILAGILSIIFLPLSLFPQLPDPPAAGRNFSNITSYEELSAYVQALDDRSELLQTEVIGQSVQGRDLYGLKFSGSGFGRDSSRILVMVFAQQHGNEQSGKEGALLLARELLREENRYLFDRIDLLLVPQVNPDGSEVNKRRNASDMDLNRNHLVLTEPETQALHRLFDKYRFEVSMDVHEYSPYGDEWKKYGARKNSEVTVGTTTNPNVSATVRDLSRRSYLPFILDYLTERGFSAHEYLPGGPPGNEYIRRSTFDINDGRQSLGIQNTFSFIQEGMNGTDSYTDNLERRAKGQCAGMRGLLEYVYLNKDEIKDLVFREKQRLVHGTAGNEVAIQCEHFNAGEPLELPLLSYFSGKDTIVSVNDFRSEVRALYSVARPAGYLVPRSNPEMVDWVARQGLFNGLLKSSKRYLIEEYFITGIDSVDFEGDKVVDPQLEKRTVGGKVDAGDYIYIPTNQIKGNLVVIALEPKSMPGLVTYQQYSHLLKAGETFPVRRVVDKKHH